MGKHLFLALAATLLAATLQANATDNSLIRLYRFDQKGDSVRNLAQKGAGTLLIGAKEPYRQYSDDMLEQEFPVWVSGRSPGKPALRFKSAKNSVSCSQFYGTDTNAMSVELWLRTSLNPGDKGNAMLLSVGSGFGSGWFLGTSHYNVYLRLGRAKEEGGDIALDIPKPLSGHVWHQLVAEVGKGVASIYVDGELAGEKRFDGVFNQPSAPGGHFAQCPEEDRGGLKIGSVREPLNNLDFDCDELAIYNRPLSADEAKKSYEAGKSSFSQDEPAAQVSIELPNEYYGYFPHGARTQLVVTAASPFSIESTMTDIDGKIVLQTQGADIVIPERRGLYWLTARVKDANGKVLKERVFPLASCVPVPPMAERPASSPIAAHGAVDIWPEATALGARCERDISVWRPKNPDGSFNWATVDKRIDANAKLGMDMMYCEQAHSYDKADLDKVVNGDASAWEAWFRPLVERYKGRVKYWEVCNEPNARGCTPDQYVALLKAAHKIIRELDPQAKIVALCGVTTYPEWTEDVLAKGGGDYFDILSFHNYIGGSPLSEWRKYHKIEHVKGSMEKHLGKVLPIWNTESGIHQSWRVNGKPLNDDELLALYTRGGKVDGKTLVPADAITMATEHVGACWQTQSLLLDCALGVQRYFILMGPSRFYPAYTGPTNGYPSEKGMALAALASFMGDMKECKLIPMESSSSAGVIVTTNAGKRVAALFSDIPVTRCFKVKENSVLKGMDFIGNPLEFKARGVVLPVRFGMEPVYIFDVPEDFAELPVLSIKAFPAMVSPNAQVSGVLKVSNLFPERLGGILDVNSPGSTTSYENKLSLEPGTSVDVPFTLATGPIRRGVHELKATLVADGKELALAERAFSSEGVARPVPLVAKEIKLDAAPTEWADIPAEVADSPEKVVIGKPPVGYYEKNSWQGPEDLSFTLKTAWRKDDGVYFLLTVVDDKLKTVPSDKVGSCFLQDALEFFFDGRALKDQTPVYSFGAEQILVRPSVEDTAKACLFKNCAKYGESVELEFAGKRTATGYVLEGRVRPKAGSPFKLVPGERFGMDFVVDDAADAADAAMTRRTQMALHGSASNNLDASNFGRYQLVEANAATGKNLLGAAVWNFDKPKDGKVKGEIKQVDGSDVFSIEVATNAKGGYCWETSVPVTAGASFSMSLQAKARISGKAQYCYGDASVFFLDEKGSWVGHEHIGSTPAFDAPQWGTLNKDFMAPANACRMGLRLGCATNVEEDAAEFQFKDVVVK